MTAINKLCESPFDWDIFNLKQTSTFNGFCKFISIWSFVLCDPYWLKVIDQSKYFMSPFPLLFNSINSTSSSYSRRHCYANMQHIPLVSAFGEMIHRAKESKGKEMLRRASCVLLWSTTNTIEIRKERKFSVSHNIRSPTYNTTSRRTRSRTLF